jgi:hypothetical protein
VELIEIDGSWENLNGDSITQYDRAEAVTHKNQRNKKKIFGDLKKNFV